MSERWVRGDVESCGGRSKTRKREKRKSGGVRHKKRKEEAQKMSVVVNVSTVFDRTHKKKGFGVLFPTTFPLLRHRAFFYIQPVLQHEAKAHSPHNNTHTQKLITSTRTQIWGGTGNKNISFGAIFFFSIVVGM